jgi:hypothetical protein
MVRAAFARIEPTLAIATTSTCSSAAIMGLALVSSWRSVGDGFVPLRLDVNPAG